MKTLIKSKLPPPQAGEGWGEGEKPSIYPSPTRGEGVNRRFPISGGFVVGWDIGGAHLKAVLIGARGKVLAVKLVYCPLWRGLHELDAAMNQVLTEFKFAQQPVSHFVTMTGELADIFPNRHAGVMQIAQFVHKKISAENPADIQFFAGEKGFVSLNDVESHTNDIASMNWLASVQYVAKNISNALFLDIGSTTTDITLIRDGKLLVLGLTDAARMQQDALVYTGVVRTPLMALAQKIVFAGKMVNVAAEHFATTADVYTLTGDLPLTENSAETADGAEKTIEASARRIARMIGCDADDESPPAWRDLAFAFKQAQLQQIKLAMLQHISILEDVRDLQIIGAGAGDFLVRELAKDLGFKYQSVMHLIKVNDTLENKDVIQHMTAVCFPAYAVARLGSQC